MRSHSIIKNKKTPWKYSIDQLGYNYRLTDIQSALGISQLKKLKMFIKRKKKIAKIYDKKFYNLNYFDTPIVTKHASHSYHLYPLKIKFEKLKISKDIFLKKLRSKGINLQVHYIPIYHHNLYKIKNRSRFLITESFFNQVVSLPIYYSLTNTQVYFITSTILKIVFSNLKKKSKT